MVKKTKRVLKWAKEKNKKKYIGIHLLAEFWSNRVIKSPKELERILREAAKKSKNTPLEVVVHKFNPQGMTGIILVAESHISLHFWPEINYLAVDIFTCGKKTMPYRALEYLKKELKPKRVEIKEVKRGILR